MIKSVVITKKLIVLTTCVTSAVLAIIILVSI